MAEGEYSTLDAKSHAGMPHGSISVRELGADRSDIWPQRLRHHLPEPAGLDDFDFVAEQQNYLAGGTFDCVIEHSRVVERSGERDNAHALVGNEAV